MATAEQNIDPNDSGFKRLFSGRTTIDFIGRSRLWLIVVIATVALCLLGGWLRGLNFSIDFTGGTAYLVTDATGEFTGDELRDAVIAAGAGEAIVQVFDGGEGAQVSTPAVEEIGGDEQAAVIRAIETVTGVERESIAVSAVGPRWGQQITSQALRALVVFLALVVVYISLRFEWRMAIAALATLIHDVLVTAGIYAIVGFEVSPASVIALLTILGFSLYDTVVVFDRVAEDTAGLSSVSTVTYGETANRALNEVLVRSLSTTMAAILPVGSLLFIGATLLGADTLRDLALALFVGMAVGAYSSVIVATPLLVWLKEKEPKWAELKARVQGRRGSGDLQPAQATAGALPQAAAASAAAQRPRPAAKKTSRAKRRR